MSTERNRTNQPSKRDRLSNKKKCLLHKLGKIMKSLGNHDADCDEEEAPNAWRNDDFVDPEFAELREERFLKLRNAIARNIHETSGHCFDAEAIALQIEQRAIIAAILGPVYEKVVNELISKVESATRARKVYFPSDSFPTSFMETFSPASSLVTNGARGNFPARESLPTPPPVAKVIPTVAVATPTPAEVVVKVEKPSERPVSHVQPQLTETTEVKAESENEEEVEAGLTDFICHQMDLSPSHDSHIDDSMHVNDEVDLDNLMKILEGDEEDDENHEDAQSEPHAGLDNRLQSMFGDDDEDSAATDAANAERIHAAIQKKKALRKKITQWRNERYIFLHKVFKATKKMNALRFYRVRRNFIACFGEDSDFENEEEFGDKDKFIECCVRRISPTVVNFIRPYYRQRRINCTESYIFKNLVTRIADSLVAANYSPSDHDVRCQVDAFFPPGQKYMNLTDVWCFEP